MTSPNATDRVQELLDNSTRKTSYEAFCDLLDDLAAYAEVKSWNFLEEAQTAAFVASGGRGQ